MATAEPNELAELRHAVDGLLYPSESDQPFTILSWPAAPGSARDQVAARAPGQKLDEVRAGQFFGELTTSDDAKRFDKLRELLQKKLTGLTILRAGSGPEISVYLLGRLSSGEWAVLKTLSVET